MLSWNLLLNNCHFWNKKASRGRLSAFLRINQSLIELPIALFLEEVFSFDGLRPGVEGLRIDQFPWPFFRSCSGFPMIVLGQSFLQIGRLSDVKRAIQLALDDVNVEHGPGKIQKPPDFSGGFAVRTGL